jgi:glutathione S-transferase
MEIRNSNNSSTSFCTHKMTEFNGHLSEHEIKEAITVAYWTIRGLAGPLRAMVMYSDHPLRAICYETRAMPDGSFDRSDWTTVVKPILIERNPLINLPYVEMDEKAHEHHEHHHHKTLVTQSNACLSFLGRKLGMYGSNPQEEAEIEQLMCEAMDLRNAMIRFAYQPLQGKPVEAKAAGLQLMQNACGAFGSFRKMEKWLHMKIKQGQSGHFLVGDAASAADFHFFEMLDQYRTVCLVYSLDDKVDPTHLSLKAGAVCEDDHDFDELGFPCTARYFDSWMKSPRMAKHIGCPLWRMPFNNKMAHFGSAEAGKTFVYEPGYKEEPPIAIY